MALRKSRKTLVFGAIVVAGLFVLHCTRDPPDHMAVEIFSVEPTTRVQIPQSAADLDAEVAVGTDGRWFEATRRSRDKLSLEELESIKKLESVGYLNAAFIAPQESGVTRHNPNRSQPGLNFYTSGHAPEALLVDMEGQVLHRWTFDHAVAWPEMEISPTYRYFRRAYLYENGDVLAIFEGHGMVKMDRSSQLLWKQDLKIHHDLEVLENGEIWVLDRRAEVVPELNEKPILEDFVVILDEDGSEVRRVSMLEALRRSDLAHVYDASRSGDIFHTNTLEVLDGRFSEGQPWLAAGNVLTSFKHLDVLAVVDMQSETVVKAWKGSFRVQHDPKLLDSGNILFFDNEGTRAPVSRAVEFDPATARVEWVFAGSQEEPFYTATCGTADRLPNGNTLLTESDAGRVLEVTPSGEVVWEYVNPHRGGEGDQLIAALLEMIRLPADFPLDWIASD